MLVKERIEKWDTSSVRFATEELFFMMDDLVYLGNNKNDMKKLIKFLKEVNVKFKVKSFSTGISFKLRETGKSLQS